MCSDPVIRAPFSGCAVGVLAPGRHQTRHLVLGQPDLLAAERRQAQIGDLEVGQAAVVLITFSRLVVDLVYAGRGWGRRRSGAASSRSCLSCSKRSQSSGSTSSGRLASAFSHRRPPPQVAVIDQAGGERHVREATLELVEQLLQRAEPLELRGSVDPIARRRRGGEPGRPARRSGASAPTTRSSRMLRGSSAHPRRQTLPRACQGLEAVSRARSQCSALAEPRRRCGGNGGRAGGWAG